MMKLWKYILRLLNLVCSVGKERFLERVLFVGTKLGTASFKNNEKRIWKNSLYWGTWTKITVSVEILKNKFFI